MEFKEFCEKVVVNLSIEFSWMSADGKTGHSMIASKTLPKPKYFVDFCDLSTVRDYYVAEVFDSVTKFYLGSISFEETKEEGNKFEHFEIGVSPTKRYNEKNMPIDENGNEIDGELWQFYYGTSLKRACNSLLKGGTATNPKRKPIRIW